MVAGRYDLEIDQRANYELVLTLKNADETAFDLTSYVPRAQIRKTYGSPLIMQITATLTDAEGGVITLTLTEAQTAELGEDEYQWDLVIDDTSEVIRILDGLVKVNLAITEDVAE